MPNEMKWGPPCPATPLLQKHGIATGLDFGSPEPGTSREVASFPASKRLSSKRGASRSSAGTFGAPQGSIIVAVTLRRDEPPRNR
jgi:hypothetical protein